MPWPGSKEPRQWAMQPRTRVGTALLRPEDFSFKNLKDMTMIRGKMGLEFAFLEDEQMLQAIRMVIAAKGLHSTLDEGVKQESQLAADQKTEAVKAKAVMEVIGPRGGLPSTKGDLLDLASLLHVDVSECKNIDQIKRALRPMVQAFLQKPSGDGHSNRSGIADGAPAPTTPMAPGPSPSSATTTTAPATPVTWPMMGQLPPLARHVEQGALGNEICLLRSMMADLTAKAMGTDMMTSSTMNELANLRAHMATLEKLTAGQSSSSTSLPTAVKSPAAVERLTPKAMGAGPGVKVEEAFPKPAPPELLYSNSMSQQATPVDTYAEHRRAEGVKEEDLESEMHKIPITLEEVMTMDWTLEDTAS